MASTKSAATLDRETSQRVNARATKAELVRLLAEVTRERDFFKQNSLRKEGVIQMLQKKVDRLSGQARPASRRPTQDELAVYFAANPDRKSVSPAELAAFFAG